MLYLRLESYFLPMITSSVSLAVVQVPLPFHPLIWPEAKDCFLTYVIHMAHLDPTLNILTLLSPVILGGSPATAGGLQPI
jgi:hypothetical protein